MKPQHLEQRCKRFAVRVISLVGSLPMHPAAGVVGSQLVRSASTIGAQYRAACHAQTEREFRTKLSSAKSVADESMYWLHLLVDSEVVDGSRAAPLVREAESLLAAMDGRRGKGKTLNGRTRLTGTHNA